MRKILFVQHLVSPPGGGPAIGAFMLDVLKKYGEITLLTLAPFKPEDLDEYYGTNLSSAKIQTIIVKDPWLEITGRLGIPSGLLRLHAMMKAAKTLLASEEFDLVCSGYDEQDLGTPCLQYIHFPWNYYPRPDAPEGWNENGFLSRVILVYSFFCQLYSGFSYDAVCQNLTMANSAWTGEKAREKYPKLKYMVLNPPALAERIDSDPAQREAKFLSIGRCAHEKEWLTLIDIVKGLRERGHDVGLTLAGSSDSGAYEQLVRERAQAEGDWVSLRLNFSREELQELLSSHRYGLHGMKEEHYGMAVAELILGGCLTSVYNDGGQVEIVTNPALRYHSVEDAVEKWDAVLRDEDLASRLLQEQLDSRSHLTRERFLQEFDEVARLCLERGVTGAIHELIQNETTPVPV